MGSEYSWASGGVSKSKNERRLPGQLIVAMLNVCTTRTPPCGPTTGYESEISSRPPGAPGT